ncbi:MAG: DUF3473 domain-containing protein [Actinobacteria bacterium]|nr:DUF3473 domain-containing protein [Actinomycetota bacterium]
MLNAMTIDVEDWFHVSRFRKKIHVSEWPALESRVSQNVSRILKLLEEYNVKATFFILAWVAEHQPDVVRAIQDYGHEIGTHGYGHQLIYEQTQEEFDEDLQKSVEILENISGVKVSSYRAPSFSINLKSLWAFEVLKKSGIDIDSSFFPVKHDLYGGIQSPSEFFRVPVNGSGTLVECPLATVSMGNKNFPIAGGGYLRMFPLWMIEKGIRAINQSGRPAVIYFHPWELDELQPRVHAGAVDQFLHYNNIDQTEKKLYSLLQKFEFSTLSNVIASTKITKTWPRW